MSVRRALQFRRWPHCILLVPLLALAGYAGLAQKRQGLEAGWRAALASAGQVPPRQFANGHLPDERSWGDSRGDGFPDLARLDRAADQENFTRWLTFLAEALYYQPAPSALAEVQDCAALIRYACRNALVAHTPGLAARGRPGLRAGLRRRQQVRLSAVAAGPRALSHACGTLRAG